MRVVLDTNILISALLQPTGRCAELLDAWNDGRFDLFYCEELIDEFRRVTRSEKLGPLIPAALAGRLLNDVRNTGVFVGDLPDVDVAPDPWDNFLLALCSSASADFLTSGDKADLLKLRKHRKTQIVSVQTFAKMLKS